MLAGIQEIFTIIFIIICIFFIPRFFRHTNPQASYNRNRNIRAYLKLSGKMRIAIVCSFMLPIVMLFILKPWKGDDIILFLSFGILPVALGWALFWIKAGFKDDNSK